jgi:putative peptidoglycan lipid II flippase
LYRLGLLPRPRFNLKDEGVIQINRLMLPALLGVSVSQINLLVDTLMASFLMTGSVSWLYYSDRLMEFPVAVFGLALATVILPDLSKIVARGDTQAYSHTLDWALRWVFLVTVPAMVGLIVLAEPILATLFYNGEFTVQDVMKTSYSLMAYAVGLSGFVLVKVLASGFYSRQDTRTPVKIAVIAMSTNMILNIALIFPLQHAGLALATALAALLNTGLLYRGLRQQNVFQPQPGWFGLFLRIGIASTCMAISLRLNMGSLAEWLLQSKLEQFIYLFGWIIGGIIIYVMTLFSSGFRLQQVRL